MTEFFKEYKFTSDNIVVPDEIDSITLGSGIPIEGFAAGQPVTDFFMEDTQLSFGEYGFGHNFEVEEPLNYREINKIHEDRRFSEIDYATLVALVREVESMHGIKKNENT